MIRVLFLTLLISSIDVAKDLNARIINGYEQQYKEAMLALNSIGQIPQGNLTKQDNARYKKFVEETRKKVQITEDLFQKTEALIASLRLIDPELYHRVDQLRDFEGNITDVYIHMLEKSGSKVKGFTNLEQSKSNPHVYTSGYGDYSVSVSVVFSSFRNSLKCLVHELGHILYQVPNLQSYMQYFKETYLTSDFRGDELGHLDTDPSHLSVKSTMLRFLAQWKHSSKQDKLLVKSGGEIEVPITMK